MTDTDRISKQYLKQQLMFVVALFLVALLVANAWSIHEMVTPVIVSALFTLAVSVVAGLVW